MAGRTVSSVSSSKSNTYGWLGQFPQFREWVGDRVIKDMAAHGYEITNKLFESTVGVARTDIEDDDIGAYSMLFQEMGRAAAVHPDELVFALLAAGGSTLCYDGQNFFDTDHPVLDENGAAQSVANTDGGSGTPWFLLCTNRPLKPIIFQERKKPQFQAKDAPTDDNVFFKKEFVYGVDTRDNVGFGFWQMAWGSKQTLNAANYAIARAALMGMTGDYGRPLGLMPNLLVVPPSLESAGRKILNSEYASGGETNEWKGTADLLVVPWLA